MTSTEFTDRRTTGWRAGAGNIFRHESRIWWKSRRRWIQLLLWTGLLNGMLRGFLWIAAQTNESGIRLEEPAVGVVDVFPQYLGLAVLRAAGRPQLERHARLSSARCHRSGRRNGCAAEQPAGATGRIRHRRWREIFRDSLFLVLCSGVQKPEQQKERHHRRYEVGIGDFPSAAMMGVAALDDFLDDDRC